MGRPAVSRGFSLDLRGRGEDFRGAEHTVLYQLPQHQQYRPHQQCQHLYLQCKLIPDHHSHRGVQAEVRDKEQVEVNIREQAEDMDKHRGQVKVKVRVRVEDREYHQDQDHSGLVFNADSRDTLLLTVHSYSNRVARELTQQ